MNVGCHNLISSSRIYNNVTAYFSNYSYYNTSAQNSPLSLFCNHQDFLHAQLKGMQEKVISTNSTICSWVGVGYYVGLQLSMMYK